MLATVRHVSTWAETKKLLGSFPSTWAFRGQSDATWSLQPSLERVLKRGRTNWKMNDFEAFTYSKFERVAKQYLEPQLVPSNRLEWLALMQHHGAPTRLLDWTESPYVAAYFALEESMDHCSIWALDTYWFKNSGKEKIRLAGGPTLKPQSYWSQPYIDAVFANPVEGVFPVVPYHVHQRLQSQQGLFLYPGNVNTSFVENLASHAVPRELRKHMYRIVIPDRVRAEALDDLYLMNIGRATLFPGLDGFAQSLRYQIAVWSDEDYMMSAVTRSPGKNVRKRPQNRNSNADESAGAVVP